MSQFHLPWTIDQLEVRLRRVITDGLETRKIDFKRELDISDRKTKVDLTRDVCAIANSDDTGAHQDYGFLIFGAAPGQLVGGVRALDVSNRDSTGASFVQFLKEFVAPVPTVHLVQFSDPKLGAWGALVIPPSAEQPHVFVREHGSVRPGDVFVRLGETTAIARAEDYGRFARKAVASTVASFEKRLQEQDLRLTKLERRRQRGDRSQIDPSPSEASTSSPPQNTAELIRAQLGGRAAELDSALLADALHVAARRDQILPWAMHSRHATPAALRDHLDQLEALAEPVARAVASLCRYDVGVKHGRSLRRAAELVGDIPGPPPGTPFTDEAIWLRAYPFVLVLYAALLPSIAEQRVGHVMEILSARPSLGPRERVASHAFHHVRASGYLTELFNRARDEGRTYFYPQGDRIAGCMRRWLGDVAVGANASGLFFTAEFLLTLFGLERGQPVQGLFLYMSEAEEPIRRFLAERPTWADPLFRSGLRAALELFDARGEQLLQRGAWGRAEFFGETVPIYDGKPR